MPDRQRTYDGRCMAAAPALTLGCTVGCTACREGGLFCAEHVVRARKALALIVQVATERLRVIPLWSLHLVLAGPNRNAIIALHVWQGGWEGGLGTQ